MKMPLEMETKKKSDEIIAHAVAHLPIVKEFAMKLGIVEIVNELVPSQMEEDPGTIFLAMILDTLSGRTPLYRLDEFFENQDTELLLGKNPKAEAFEDYNVARVLDKAYNTGTMKIFTEISKRAVLLFDVETVHVSFDTTSISVFGEYEQCSGESAVDVPFAITHGYSKDHRPDLKQFLISMLCVGGNIPVFGRTEDGNASDKTINNDVPTRVSKHLAQYGIAEKAYVYIADSAVVTESNLERMWNCIYFATRLPATYGECARAIAEAVEKDEWEDVGVLAETKPTKNRPAAYYKTYETEVELYGKRYRAVVVHSSAHDKYKVGRPANGVKEIDRILFSVNGEIFEKTEAAERFRREAGCFVLLTNVPKEGEMGHSSRGVLKAYKDQHGIERNFGFLKDPVIVNSIFLKKPERIEVLGLVLLISLLIWRLLERAMRNYVKNTGEDLPGWKKRRTNKPTSFMLTTKFAGVIVLKVAGQRQLSKPLTGQQKEYLNSLGIRSDVFTNPKKEYG